MNEFTTLLQQGNAWFSSPAPFCLARFMDWSLALQNNDGSIHHCYKGTVRQAVMLGVAATLSHTAVVWLIAFGGMYISNKFTAESAEPGYRWSLQ